MKKKCCITGHRDIPANQVDFVKEELRKQILLAIQDGYAHFISGFAEGSDLYFASIVAELKAENPDITLEAALPFRKRLETKDAEFQRLIKLCDKKHISAENFIKNCYFVRNMYMVNQSERVIAVYDGREGGGTAFTMLYANTVKRELHVINVEKQ